MTFFTEFFSLLLVLTSARSVYSLPNKQGKKHPSIFLKCKVTIPFFISKFSIFCISSFNLPIYIPWRLSLPSWLLLFGRNTSTILHDAVLIRVQLRPVSSTNGNFTNGLYIYKNITRIMLHNVGSLRLSDKAL